ncbi:MAG: ParB/RepB/Spo0J family partition protein [Lachnospiraceae bacterium]|nr:ParB/RepB/Spo0J family partition protein [Lachnospiraceae bacterium]
MAARGLGKGLDAMIPKAVKEEKVSPKEEIVKPVEGDVITKVKLTKIEPNRDQPRKNFDEDALEELADSIKLHGVITPIILQDRMDHYEIIAGERRWRAARKAGLKDIPAIIKNYTEKEIAEIALLENLQREDLNPIEEAMAYKRLMEEFSYKQDELAERVSKSRSAVANAMRLLKLADDVQRMLIEDKISMGHARALLAIEDPQTQYEIAERVFDEKLSVRDIEKIVKNLSKQPKEKKFKNKEEYDVFYKDIAEKLKTALGTKVNISGKGDGTGKIEVEFYSHDELDRIIGMINK